jgi:hypothetical protein
MQLLLSAVAAMLAQSASAPATGPQATVAEQPSSGPVAAAPAPPKVPDKTASATDACNTPPPSANSREIVICAVKPDGYRLNSDVMKARREARSGSRPTRPGQVPSGPSCATVGPMGCRGAPTINLIAVALTAAQISERMAKGQEVGSIFQTDPHPSEYQLYLAAKKEREAKAAEKVRIAAQKARIAAQASKQQPSVPTTPDASSSTKSAE